MKKTIHIIHILSLSIFLFIATGCMTVDEPAGPIATKTTKKKSEDELIINNVNLDKNPELLSIYKTHEINELPGTVGDKFVNLYILTREKEYLPVGNRTFCVKFFYDYFNEIGYKEVLDNIKKTNGKNMVEKAINYAEQTGEIEVLLSGYEAQKLANAGRDVGVLGEYYYDKAEKKYTVHYSVVQPSNVAYDEHGEVVPYYVTGLLTKRKDVNNRYGTGVFLAQAGIAVGLIDFRWAYNRKMNGIIQRDSKGNFRGGIIFLVFPEKKVRLLGLSGTPKYYLSIKTEPADSSIFVDGIYRGAGSATIVFMKKAEHTVLIKKPDYKEVRKVVTIGEREKTFLNITLEEYTGSIHVTTAPEKAEIFINGKKAGTSPCLISGLKTVEYKVRIQLKGHVSVYKEVTVEREKETEIKVQLDAYEMIKIEKGNFSQGAPDRDNVLPHTVMVDDFLISKYEVTCEQYEDYCINAGKKWQAAGGWGYKNKPVTHIDWYDAIEYCNWRSNKEGYAPCYEIIKEPADPNNTNPSDKKKWKVICNVNAGGYRLPTESEWEYAAGGGINSKGYSYAGSNEPEHVAWYNTNAEKKIHPVGRKKPNEAGIYDMSGNVWEWCWDWYDKTYYASSPGENPSGPGAGSFRVRRGGSAFNTDTPGGYLEITSRFYLQPDSINAFTGFRVVRRAEKKQH